MPTRGRRARRRRGSYLPTPDPLTAFCADLRRRVIECQKFNVPLSLILMNIDEFKAIT